MRLQRELQLRPVTLVWLDSDEAILLRSEGSAGSDAEPPGLRRVRSEVPPHRRSAGHAHHDPRARSGGGADPDDLVERRREHFLAAYLRQVSELVPPGDRVVVMGPGPVHARLANDLRAADARHRRERPIEDEPAEPLSERQLQARLRALAGRPAERRRPANAGARR